MNEPAKLNLTSVRANQARLAKTIGVSGYRAMLCIAVILVVAGAAALVYGVPHIPYFCFAVALALAMPAAWYHLELSALPPSGAGINGRISADVLALLRPGRELTPKAVWEQLRPHWQVIFMTNHLLLDGSAIGLMLSDSNADMEPVWRLAMAIADAAHSPIVEPGYVAGALLYTSPAVTDYLKHFKLSPDDVTTVTAWLSRVLDSIYAEKPYFGGIGRDWANGFTPRLNEYGFNISLAIEHQGAHFGWLTTSPGVTAIKSAFSQGASTVALIGDDGIGKTSHVYALAQLLLEEKNDRNLEHRQIISLNPSAIISAARRPGELEQLVMTLMGEAAHAGHIILFLDDAELFFSSGTGSFDMSRILLPVLQSRAVQIVMALTPHDYQRLKSTHASFANLVTPVVLRELPEPDVLSILEDASLNLETKHKTLITYEAIREAYRLSGRYMVDIAYPGKAIRLLEQSMSYAEHDGIVTPASVQQAIEQSQGVKVAAATPVEADDLLNLEDKIHERMINQSQAVHVVASALRRARAGVANPKRPIGSFLFLGPTGVGKTELAKAVAATYFRSESSMIRLDMSEYQQPDDVQRLLSDGTQESRSLIMAVRQQPFSVVLLDEIEKAHPNVLNLLLQLLDEGQLTDASGRAVSFKDCVIIATSNAGANTIRDRITNGEEIESFQDELTDELIGSGQFRPELLNRFDEIVVFRPLNQDELAQVVGLMLGDINKTLSTQNISVELSPAAIHKIVEVGYDPRLGARPMRRALQRAVEDAVAGRILRGEAQPGDHITLDEPDLALA